MPITLNGDTGIQTPMYNGTITANAVTPSVNMKNRIINGAMVISQRNGTSSVTPTATTYTLDRFLVALTQASKFSVQQNAGSVTPPVGFVNYLGITSTSAYAVLTGDFFLIRHYIEGTNVSDLDWGTANAKTVTLSFWVRSSLTGTFGGSIQNNSENRSYPFSYTISSANTWEQKSITITGDTAGTWVTNTGVGMRINFGLGAGSTYSGTAGAWAGSDFRSATGATSVVGTNGATFYITGVQLEVGSTATSFDYRPYGTELALCQRYYYRNAPAAAAKYLVTTAWANQTTTAYGIIQFPTTMRTAPSALEQSGTAGDYATFIGNTATTCSAVPTFSSASDTYCLCVFTVASGLTVGQAGSVRTTGTAGYLGWSAEL